MAFVFLVVHVNMYTRSLEPDQISHKQCMEAKRGHTNRANIYGKSHLKKQRGRITIDPSTLATTVRRVQKPELKIPLFAKIVWQ